MLGRFSNFHKTSRTCPIFSHGFSHIFPWFFPYFFLCFPRFSPVPGQPGPESHGDLSVSSHAAHSVAWDHHGAHRDGWTDGQRAQVRWENPGVRRVSTLGF